MTFPNAVPAWIPPETDSRNPANQLAGIELIVRDLSRHYRSPR